MRRAGSEIFLSAPWHWFQYRSAMGFEAFSTEAGLGEGGGGLLTTGARTTLGASSK